MSFDAPGIAEDLAALKAAYVGRLPARLQAIEEAARRAADGDGGAWREVASLAHRLAGTAAMYRFTQLSRAARVLESRAASAAQTGARRDSGILGGVLDDLRR